MNKLIAITFLLLLIVADCSADPVIVPLKVNHKVSVDDGNLVITLVRIIEDHRCPINIDCVWSGYAKVQLRVKAGTIDYGHHFIANIANRSWNLTNEITLDKYRIRLGFRDIAPERVENRMGGAAAIEQADYVVSLTVDYK